MPEKIVRIEHPETGKRYAVSESAYTGTKLPNYGNQSYEEAGFKVMSYEDGSPYEGEPTKYGVNRAAGSPEIGSETSNATNIDGDKANEAELLDAGLTPEERAPRRAASRKAAE